MSRQWTPTATVRKVQPSDSFLTEPGLQRPPIAGGFERTALLVQRQAAPASPGDTPEEHQQRDGLPAPIDILSLPYIIPPAVHSTSRYFMFFCHNALVMSSSKNQVSLMLASSTRAINSSGVLRASCLAFRDIPTVRITSKSCDSHNM